LQQKEEMEEELERMARELLDECDIDVYREEDEAEPSVYDDIDRAADEARRRCDALNQAYYNAQNIEHDIRQQEQDRMAILERYENAMKDVQSEYDELMALYEELRSLESVVISGDMTEEEKEQAQVKLDRRHALESYIIANQEREVNNLLKKWNIDSYQELEESYDRARAALEETRRMLPAAVDARIQARDAWIKCQRDYLLEQADRNNWRESDLHVDHGYLFD
jgi:ElaB/YqjD/DUF883 family membrane-anchored ribosome-binding protein